MRLNSGIYKNSFTCAVPGTGGMGCALAAALGAVAGDPDKKLTSTEGASDAQIEKAKRLVESGAARAELFRISPDIYIESVVKTERGSAKAVVRGRHDAPAELTVNGVELPVSAHETAEDGAIFRVSSVSFEDILSCVDEAGDLGFMDDAVRMNMELFEEGKRAGLIPLTLSRIRTSSDRKELAELVTCGAIEARVRGASSPAMAITGSGSHGILCTLPIHAAAVSDGIAPDRERRALLLSALTTRYIKELSGLLSTACGCVLAGGTGAALGLVYLYADDKLYERLKLALDSMAASVTGMICHGGNTGCSLKAAIGVKMAFAAADMALSGCGAESIHGILGGSIEATIRNMALVAREMLPVESRILKIMSEKAGS